jgi:uncharacterized protein YdeI (YjbR/CyaY-like superfamily)
MGKQNARVDIYIARSAEFARPILGRVREVVHRACPDVVEEIKWGRPFFLYGGTILCNIAAFKEHCSIGFWGVEMGEMLNAEGALKDGGMGSLRRITSLKDLPADTKLLGYMKKAAFFVESGKGETVLAGSRRVVKAPKATVGAPLEFVAALKRSKSAANVFESFSPSCKREYVQWIAEAKRPETRERRITQAVAWIAEGKQRNWKYQNC